MSSGIDCSVVSALCKKAKVYTHLIMMPYGDNMKKTNNYLHAMELINKFNFEYHIFDIKPVVDSITIENTTELVKANIRPRIRMTYLYEYARSK